MNNMYFNYNPIMSHNAEINIITALRGVGKSYGAKVKIFNAYLKEKRTFIIKGTNGSDDYASMKEVIERRMENLFNGEDGFQTKN